MTKFINIRGCNGSGKTTVLRQYAATRSPEVRTVEVPDHKPIPVTYLSNRVAILGDYSPEATGTTAGCDRIKTQQAAKDALKAIEADAVLFEGIIVSTIFQPWSDWSHENNGMVWAFLDTPLDVCLDRIQSRNGGKPINEKLVADKWNGINRVKDKATEAGERVETLNYNKALEELAEIVDDYL